MRTGEPQRPAGTPGGLAAVLMVTAGALTVPLARSYTYRPASLAVVTVAALVLAGVCLAWRRIGHGGTAAAAGAGAALASGAAFAAWRWPPRPDVTRSALFAPSVALTVTAAVLALIAALCILTAVAAAARDRVGVALLTGGVARASVLVGGAVGAAAGILAVPGGRAPRIDVWILLRDAAAGVLDGRNPYTMTFPDVPAGQTSTCFTYLPGSFLLSVPGHLLGDIRYAEALLFVTPLLLLAVRAVRSHRGHATGGAAAALVPVLALVLPATPRVLQQAWTDSLLVGLLTIVLLCRRSRWVVLPLGLALATKQHALLLLPLLPLWFGWRRTAGAAGVAAAAGLPFLLLSPARFVECTVTFFLDLPMTGTSVSWWTVLPDVARTPLLTLVLLLLAYAACWRLPRSRAAFFAGAALVQCAFDLGNKQSYVNQWWFAGHLLMLAAAALLIHRDREEGFTRRPWPAAGTLTAMPDSDPAPASREPTTTRRGVLAAGALTGVLASTAGCSLISQPVSPPRTPDAGARRTAGAAGPTAAVETPGPADLDVLTAAAARLGTLEALTQRVSASGTVAVAVRGLRHDLAAARSAVVELAGGAALPTEGGRGGRATLAGVESALSSGSRRLLSLAAQADAGTTARTLSSAAAGLEANRWHLRAVRRSADSSTGTTR